MLLLKKRTFEVGSDAARVASEDAAALVRAEEIVTAAEEEAAQIREEAKAAFEREKERGYAEGIANGKAEILGQKLDLVDESIDYIESVEGALADLVVKAIRKCVAELDDTELVAQLVRRSLQAVVRTQREVSVKVAPDKVDVVKAQTDALISEFPTVRTLTVEADARLTGEACIVETASGIVEASIEGQLAAIERSIARNFKGRKQVAD